MKKMNIYTAIAAMATILATVVATSACIFFAYQPEEPQSLRDE